MYAPRPERARVDRYTGPYERFVTSPELGLPFAFPALRETPSGYYTALLEGTMDLPALDGMQVRLPPLWNPRGKPRAVTPFAFSDPDGGAPDDTPDMTIARLLDAALTADDGMDQRFRVNFPVATEAWTPTYLPHHDMTGWTRPATKPKAIVAVIDDGLPFANRAFLDSTGRTRISHIWLQSARAKAEAAVPFGREFVNTEIDALRAAHPNERSLYESCGAIDSEIGELGTYLRRGATHGSHIMGVAAGNDSRFLNPIGDEVQIIAVQLPNTIAWDTSGFGKEMYMLSALNYVFNRAREVAAAYADDPSVPEELPLIVNFSYGWSASRHDGQSEMELAIEELLSERKAIQPATAITMPTGNNFHSGMHGQWDAADMAGGSYAFGWKVKPGDRTSSYLELWLPEGFDPSGYSLEVTPPEGVTLDCPATIPFTPDEDLNPVGDPRRFIEVELGGQNIGQLSVDQHRGNRWRAIVALIPTVRVPDVPRHAPSGLWTIRLVQGAGAALAPDQVVNVWVHRDDDPGVLGTGGRQSQLVDLTLTNVTRGSPLCQYAEDMGFRRGYGALNGVGSSPSVTRVAGYVQTTKRPSYYSGAGGLTVQAGQWTPWGAQTTVAAVSEPGMTVSGTASLGITSGSGTRLSGTSAAAPAVARLMVLNAAAGRDLLAGFTPRPDPHHCEAATPAAAAQHAARLGAVLAPPVSR